MLPLLLIALLWAAAATANDGPGRFAAFDRAVAEAATPSARTEALVRRGEAHRVAGAFRKAFGDFAAAAAAAPSGPERRFALAALGVAQADLGLPEAEATLRQALGEDGRPSTAAEAVAAARLARLLARAGVASEATSLAEAAAQTAGDGPLGGVALTALADARLVAGDEAGAESALAQGIDRFAAMPRGRVRGGALLAAARVALSPPNPSPRLSAMAGQALDAASPTSDPRLAAALDDMKAESARLAGDLEAAFRLSGRAVAGAQRVGANDLAFRVSRRRAEIAKAFDRPQAALAAYRIAFASLQSVRLDLAVQYDAFGRSLYRREFESFHSDFLDLLLREAGDSQAGLAEAVAVLEDLKVLEIEDYFGERCVRRADESAVTDVGGDTALIYPIVLADRIELIFAQGGAFHRRSSPIDARRLKALINFALRRTVDFRGDFKPASKRLHELLIGPVEDLLQRSGVRTIVYAPDGALRSLPLASLWNGERFLVERFDLATVLGVNLVEPAPIDLANGRFLAAGASSTSIAGFQDLPGVVEETRRLADLLGGDLRVDQEFRVAEAPRILRSGPYNVVHIAAHATFGASPKDNFIALADGRLDLPALVTALRARSIERDQRIDMLTLSACQTALGNDRAPLGLAGAAYRANARSVVASLWRVPDAVTANMMVDLYAGIADDGMGRAKALANAQRKILQSDGAFSHPGFWAAFIVVGDWR